MCWTKAGDAAEEPTFALKALPLLFSFSWSIKTGELVEVSMPWNPNTTKAFDKLQGG